jgi:hypothetical protein
MCIPCFQHRCKVYKRAHCIYYIYMPKCGGLHPFGVSQSLRLEKSRGPSWGKNARCPSNLRRQGATLSYQVKKGWDNPNYLEQKNIWVRNLNRQTISIQIFSHGVPSFKAVFIRNNQSCLHYGLQHICWCHKKCIPNHSAYLQIALVVAQHPEH